ncbi:MAG TPA: urate hydroxylase PuuD [Gaiellaceae bacterium]|nr:urate hydroxylase PuuD [Gaiellaceae bacterium]
MIVAVDPYLVDWLDLTLRWLHVIAGVVWIGTSFYFVALDNHLAAPKRREDAEAGVAGESWEIHGGGFYLVQKFRVAPRTLPEPLHWFKWEAYTTWLSGFALFCVLYYVDADLNLVGADMSEWAAIVSSLALLAAAWLVYDVLCRAIRNELVLAAVLVALVTATAYGLSLLYTDRAVWLQLGAMLGTIMVANVFFVIIPAHWELIRAKQAGREPDPAPGIRAKQRSVHNNYLTLPVLVAMLGDHFAFAYGNEDGWLVLVCLMVVGAWIRLFFNLRHGGRTVWWIPVTAALALTAIAIWIRPPDTGGAGTGPPVAYEQIEPIIEARCGSCHVGPGAPAGVRLESREQIEAQAGAIEQVAVLTKTMPLNNATSMTDAERQLLARWIASRR